MLNDFTSVLVSPEGERKGEIFTCVSERQRENISVDTLGGTETLRSNPVRFLPVAMWKRVSVPNPRCKIHLQSNPTNHQTQPAHKQHNLKGVWRAQRCLEHQEKPVHVAKVTRVAEAEKETCFDLLQACQTHFPRGPHWKERITPRARHGEFIDVLLLLHVTLF